MQAGRVVAMDEVKRLRSLVTCTCGQLLAEEWERGAYNIVGTTRIRVDERRRVTLVCPSCGKRTRLYVADAA